MSLVTNVTENFKFVKLNDESEQTKDEINNEILHCLFAEINNDPRTFQEAMESEDRVEWLKAILE